MTRMAILSNNPKNIPRSWLRYVAIVAIVSVTIFAFTFYTKLEDWKSLSVTNVPLISQRIDAISETDKPPETTTSHESRIKPTKRSLLNDNIVIRKHGFVVYSEKCQIPDVDPYHPTVKHLISITPPLNCAAEYRPLTHIERDTLRINVSWVEFHANRSKVNIALQHSVLFCCVEQVTRDDDGHSDDHVKYSKPCERVVDGQKINFEFIRVICSLDGHQIYLNYHSFVFDKPETETRSGFYYSNEEPVARPDRYSILIVGIDAMSRLNSQRQLKQTLEYLKTSLNAIEMKGFNKVGDNTFPNLIPMLTGFSDTQLEELCRGKDPHEMDNCTMIWSRFAEAGYRTLYAEDTPQISSFNYLKKGFLKQPTDYYFRTMMLPLEKQLGRNKKMNCNLCAGSVSEVEAVLDYLHKFVQQFGKRSYFGMAWTNSMSHDFLNSASSGDHFYANFFKTLNENSSLKDTFVIVMGDHGQRWGEIRSTHIGRLEERLPMLLIAPPETFKIRHPGLYNNLVSNKNRLVTTFDLFATMENILNFDGSAKPVDETGVPSNWVKKYVDRARTLFAPIPVNRGCEDAGIVEAWCTCHQANPIKVDDPEVIHVVEFTLEALNRLLADHSKCAQLTLGKVSKATLRTPHDKLVGDKKDSSIFDYTVVFETLPGNAIFESTVRFVPYKHDHSLLGDVSRLNLYGNQSECVHDNAVVRKYCFCK